MTTKSPVLLKCIGMQFSRPGQSASQPASPLPKSMSTQEVTTPTQKRTALRVLYLMSVQLAQGSSGRSNPYMNPIWITRIELASSRQRCRCTPLRTFSCKWNLGIFIFFLWVSFPSPLICYQIYHKQSDIFVHRLS